MSRFLAWFQIIPALIKVVRELEDAIPITGAGPAKIELLIALARAFYEAEEHIRKEIPWDSLRGVIVNAVAIVVKAFNALGIFKKAVVVQ